MGYPDTFEGFCVDSPKTWNKFYKHELKPKPFEEHDIDVKIEACGVCGSDVHTLTGGWGDFKGPLCVGHEVVGRAVKVGKEVKNIREGDRVGVGAQIWACLKCQQCQEQNENYCPQQIDTYNAQYPDGSSSHGGYSSHIRAHEYFTFKIPDALPSEAAAPLLCAGITTYSPMFRAGVGPGKKVAVVGLGGLGHIAVQFAVALGAEAYVITHSPGKSEDAKTLGAKEVIVSGEEGWHEKWAFTFDFILNTADALDQFDLSQYLSTLRVCGQFHTVGISDKPLPELTAFAFAPNAAKLTGSHLGNHQEMNDMLKLAAEKKLRPWVQTIDVSEEGCREAIEKVKNNDVRYRFTLVNYDKAFGSR
ncbi:hypothetical protein MAPG_05608 [Magnaporthiopsis poae ATCC 64411]|uniref:Enoyl reductase (ER) domain-containing protein n=1 Tax=Magnaporthiopsis poae (strain ATCC 64411 / 73-15) TaxID=644358 RepID=A0A0C4DZV0_MAGP6|nr:hypothetical protein MAPG_05608 [Magnaporthiopsis poae ATCC 64411]